MSIIRTSLLLLLSFVLLTACRSERVAFDFGPLPRTARPDSAQEAATSLPPAVGAAALPASSSAAGVAAAPTTTANRASSPVRAAQPRRLAAVAQKLARPATICHRAHMPAAARPADQGLGKIFFFLLAVVLAVLAGLAFGVAAIFSIGFWAALGYVAAGIVVLLLLRSLVRKLAGKK